MKRSNRKYLTLIAVLITFVYLFLPDVAFSAEKAVIVGFHEKPGPSEQALIHGAKGIIKRTFQLIPAMAASLPEEEIAKIKKNSKVAYVEDDAIVTAVEPLPGTEYVNSWGVQHIGSEVVHNSGNKGAGIKIAVIDTGIDYTHEDLDGNYKGGYNFVEYPCLDDPNTMCPCLDDPNKICTYPLDTFDDSWNGHGTHVSGIIAAEQNGIGVVGVAPEAGLYAVKVLDGSGGGWTSWLIAGLEWAVVNQMDIINLSLEVSPEEDPDLLQSLKDACDAAYNAGVLLVAAAGNNITGLPMPISYPAAYDSVIAVTATDTADAKAWFSRVGPEVELAAPGVDIMSTVPSTVSPSIPITCYDNLKCYANLSGTSQAAPHVTGTAALILSSGKLEDQDKNGIVNNEDVRLKLQNTAVDLGTIGLDYVFGYGLVDAAAASSVSDGQINFTLTRTSGSPANSAVTVPLSGALYEITIQNNDLKKVTIRVYEGDVLLKEFSTSYLFTDNKPQEVTFSLNATGKAYNVVFTPDGKNGTSANVTIEMN